MTVLPARLVIGPETMDFGISVASVALAEDSEELGLALSKLWSTLKHVRSSFNELLQDPDDLDRRINQASGIELRDFLENMLVLETNFVKEDKKLSAIIMKPKFKRIIIQAATDYDFNDLSNFLEEWRSVDIPALRRLRMVAIRTIFRRIADSGITEIHLEDDFPQMFLDLPLDQSEAWQETAFLLASSNNAKRLLRSIHDRTTDRTADLTQS